jgi:hypothetical protein
MATIMIFEKASRSWACGACGTWSAFGNVRPCGNRENPRCPRNNGKGRGARHASETTKNSSKNWGLGHYEGRVWRGFHHHATLCIAAYGFLVAERSRFSPNAPIDWSYATRNFRPSSNPAAPRARAQRHNPYSIATIRIQLARYLLQRLPCCPICCARRRQLFITP